MFPAVRTGFRELLWKAARRSNKDSKLGLACVDAQGGVGYISCQAYLHLGIFPRKMALVGREVLYPLLDVDPGRTLRF